MMTPIIMGVALRLIRVAEVSLRPPLPRPVAHLLCNRQVLRVVLDGLAKVPLRQTRIVPSPSRSPASFSIARHFVWFSIALEKSPCARYAFPRFP
jgi:hypothetical protein